MKKYIFIAVFMIFLVGGGLLVSSKLTGEATSGSTNVNVQVGNSAPSVPTIEVLSSISPNENTFRTTYISFQVKDMNGVKDINVSSAKLIVSKLGEVSKIVSCENINNVTNKIANFSCNIDIWYFETAGTWSINASIGDSKNRRGENSSKTFTYSELTSMVFSPLSMSWPTLEVTDTNVLSNANPLLINNTGNDNIAINNINFNATNLEGETFAGEYIYAGNFTIDIANSCDTGTSMNNGVALAVTNAQLPKGNNSINDGSTGQEQLYFCLEAVNDDISAQTYSTTAGGPWTMSIA